MYNPFFSLIMLAFEAQRVVELRLVRLAWGGNEGLAEAAGGAARSHPRDHRGEAVCHAKPTLKTKLGAVLLGVLSA